MIPVGGELDAAVLRAIGKDVSVDADGNVDALDGQWWSIDVFKLSTAPNGHEALRLCGPWLDERCWSWGVCRRQGLINAWAWSHGTGRGADGNYATRAEAICRLVLAVSEREGK